MVEFKTAVTPGKYVVEFTTDSFSEYRRIEDACRAIIDEHMVPPSMSVEEAVQRYRKPGCDEDE